MCVWGGIPWLISSFTMVSHCNEMGSWVGGFSITSQTCLSLARQNVQTTVEFARGTSEIPLDSTELEAKFLYCSRYILPPDHIEGAIYQISNLENIHDITGLVSILGG